MKSITAGQMSIVLQHALHHKPFTEGEFTFSLIQPWSPHAWQAECLMEEVIKAGYDHAAAILTKVHVLDPDNDVDMIHEDVNVYKQFVFPGQSSGNISHNVRTWLEEFRAWQAKPAVKLLGNRLDILEEKIPKDSYVVQNTFIVHHIEEEVTVKDFLKSINIIPGDIIRVCKFDNLDFNPVFPPFLYQYVNWNSIHSLFQVK